MKNRQLALALVEGMHTQEISATDTVRTWDGIIGSINNEKFRNAVLGQYSPIIFALDEISDYAVKHPELKFEFISHYVSVSVVGNFETDYGTFPDTLKFKVVNGVDGRFQIGYSGKYTGWFHKENLIKKIDDYAKFILKNKDAHVAEQEAKAQKRRDYVNKISSGDLGHQGEFANDVVLNAKPDAKDFQRADDIILDPSKVRQFKLITDKDKLVRRAKAVLSKLGDILDGTSLKNVAPGSMDRNTFRDRRSIYWAVRSALNDAGLNKAQIDYIVLKGV